MTSRKQRHVPAGLVAGITLSLVCLVSFFYVRFFLVVHTSLFSPSSLPLDTLPLFIVLNSHASKLEDVSPVSKSSGNHSSLPEVRCIPEVQDCASGGASSANATETKQQQQPVLVGNSIELWKGDDISSSPSEAAYNQEVEGLDLRELLQFPGPDKRRQWLKRHWSDVKILHSDEISEQFPRRIKDFLGAECSLRFFMTWISPLAAFRSRELLCLLSVFKQHPSACLVIISRSLDSERGRQVLQPLVNRGYRVLALAPDLPHLFSNTPAELWLRNLKKGRVDPGEISFRQNLSNILRLVALYKYGGIYLDNDVIVLRSFSNLSNAIGAQSQSSETGEWYRLNNAVLVFDKKHPLLHSFILEFALTFNGSKWGHNGPYLATRVLKRMLRNSGGSSNLSSSYTVLPMKAFYPVSWLHIARFYACPRDYRDVKWQEAKLQLLFENSYAVHLWNKETSALQVQSGSIVDRLFRWIIAGDPSAFNAAE